MKRLQWLVGPPAAGKSTWVAGLLHRPRPPRVLDLARMLLPLVDPSHPRKGMMEARNLLIQAIRRVELDPANEGLPPLLVVTAIVSEADLFPLGAGEEVLLLLPPRARWERQFLQRPQGHAPGNPPMSLEQARQWYEQYQGWKERALPLTLLPEEALPGAVSGREAPPLPGTRETLEALLAFDTSPTGQDHAPCVRWLCARLESLGFTCRLHKPLASAPPVIEAHRTRRGLAGHAVLYGHYDVTAARPAARAGASEPLLVERQGRWFAQGVGDNKGPLAARLMALASLEHTPALTWFLQGEEETGSEGSARVFAERMPQLQADLWLEETGYHDEDGTLRLIARTLGPGAKSLEPDAPMRQVLDELQLLASLWAVDTRLEVRGLNKAAVTGGCPFNRNLPEGARYLALGVNDAHSHVHGAGESVPLWTFPLHAEELRVVFHWVGRVARGQT
jgi:hypothetical protein